ncbi:MAG TPA: MauE/DoxX family redox-associated membrane protein [Acidimicrobiales bacterium]|nr:MauE/DoxX family redox-associated membrane protein [Acidimicrobiales bacterium]
MAVLAGPFLVSSALLGAGGALKVAHPHTTARALRSVGLPASPTVVRLGAAAEVAVAVAALATGGRPVAALVAASYLGFAAFVVAALRADVPLSSCGCFGGQDTPPTAVHLALNLLAALVAGAVALGWAGSGGGVAVAVTDMNGSLVLKAAFVVATAASAWLAYLALTVLPRLQGARR